MLLLAAVTVALKERLEQLVVSPGAMVLVVGQVVAAVNCLQVVMVHCGSSLHRNIRQPRAVRTYQER